MRKPAYTLIELLITSAIFAGVAVLSTGIFSAIINGPVEQGKQQQVQGQVQALADAIAADLRASRSFPANLTDPNASYRGRIGIFFEERSGQDIPVNGRQETWADSVVLAVPVPKPGAAQEPNKEQGEWHVYCTDTGAGGKTMRRYVVPFDRGAVPDEGYMVKAGSTLPKGVCNKDRATDTPPADLPIFRFASGTPGNPDLSSRIFDSPVIGSNTSILTFLANPILSSADSSATTPPAVRLEIAAKSTLFEMQSTREFSGADRDKAEQPVVYRSVISLRSPYGTK